MHGEDDVGEVFEKHRGGGVHEVSNTIPHLFCPQHGEI